MCRADKSYCPAHPLSPRTHIYSIWGFLVRQEAANLTAAPTPAFPHPPRTSCLPPHPRLSSPAAPPEPSYHLPLLSHLALHGLLPHLT